MGYNSKKSRALLLPKKREAFVAIRRYMLDGDIELKVEEELILNRWILCDALLKAKELTEEQIINKIEEQFKVSRYTALADIANTQKLFADARKINKKYLIHHHLQRIDEDIQKIRKRMFQYTDDEGKVTDIMPDAKELAAYAKLLETYTYTLNSVPDDAKKDIMPPPIFQFLLAPGQTIEYPMDVKDAMKEADEVIMKQNSEGVYEPENEEKDDNE